MASLLEDASNRAGTVLFYGWWLLDRQEQLPDLAVDPVRADLQDADDADLRLIDVGGFRLRGRGMDHPVREPGPAGETVKA